MINLDHAATTPVHEEALQAMLPYFSVDYANASGVYADARITRKAIDHARKRIADEIHAKASEIYFTSGGTEADNWAILGTAFAQPEKRHIVTTRIEHHAVLNTCKALERMGYEVTYVGVDSSGCVSAQDVLQAIRPDTALVSVMLANNEIGTIEPVEEIAACVREMGVMFHTDAVQAVGHIPVSVEQLGVDLLSISAHKFGGPKGIGALYVRSGATLSSIMHGGSQERGLRAGTENTPAIVGFAEALSFAGSQMKENQKRIGFLRNRLQEKLSELPSVHVNAQQARRLPGHLHISVDGFQSQMLLMRLDMAGVAASAGSACASGASVRSHVIEAMGIGKENQADIRFSIGISNTCEEIDAAAEIAKRILSR